MIHRVNRLREKLAQLEVDALLVANPSNLRYMTGFTGTSGCALITENEALFITDFRYVEQAGKQAAGYTIVKQTQLMEEALAAELSRLKVKKVGFEQDHTTYGQYLSYRKYFDQTELLPLANVIEELRVIKNPSELDLIREAVKIIDRTYEHILSFIKPGMKEIDVATELEFHMRKQGASSSSFDIIVASGVRSALPHGVASEKKIESGDFVTLDFGAVFQGYVSDMTRTFAMGEPVQQLREIYDICLQAQIMGVEQIKAGMTCREADAVCRNYIAAKGYGEFFGHSTGHGIGLDIHESPRLSVKSETVLEPGMVVTVEPGIYLAGIGGVRIEDDIVITPTGNEILTQSTKELLIIE